MSGHSQPKRHHYIPEWVLKRLASSDRFVTRIEVETGEVRGLAPKNAAVEQHLYRVSHGRPEDPGTVERWLGGMESAAKEAYERLLTDPAAITPRDRIVLATFLAAACIRSPVRLRETRAAAEGRAKLHAEAMFRYPSDELVTKRGRTMLTEMADAIASDAVRITTSDEGVVAEMFNGAFAFGLRIAQMQWGIVRTGAPLVVGDSYVTVHDPTPDGPGAALLSSPQAETFVPFGARDGIMLLPTSAAYTWEAPAELEDPARGGGVSEVQAWQLFEEAMRTMSLYPIYDRHLSPREALALNYRAYAQAGRWVYGSDEGTARGLVAASVCNWTNMRRYLPKGMVFTVLEPTDDNR